jgi:hypothetical protein
MPGPQDPVSQSNRQNRKIDRTTPPKPEASKSQPIGLTFSHSQDPTRTFGHEGCLTKTFIRLTHINAPEAELYSGFSFANSAGNTAREAVGLGRLTTQQSSVGLRLSIGRGQVEVMTRNRFHFVLLFICFSLVGCGTALQERAKTTALSAEQGDAIAQHNLGVMYQHGIGVHQSFPEALKWFRKAAEQGKVGSQINLGVMYHEGQGVAQDHAVAFEWFQKAAKQGHASGQNNLGLMYFQGHGVPQDNAEAVKWWQKAAEQGHAGAQLSLGTMYNLGLGVAKNTTEATKWWRKAADQGSSSAKESLKKWGGSASID